MKTWHWLALGAGAFILIRMKQRANGDYADTVHAAYDALRDGPNNAAPTAESANYVVPSQTVPRVPLTTDKPDVHIIPPKADGSVAFIIPGRVNPSFSSYNGDYANGQPANRTVRQ